jgi:hypothetical protein
MSKPFRRIVTGHDKSGRALIQSDSPPERIRLIGQVGPTFYEVWNTRDTPAPIDRSSGEPPEDQLTLAPPPRGTRIRVLDFPPETKDIEGIDAASARELVIQRGTNHGWSNRSGSNCRVAFILIDGKFTDGL